MQETHNVTCDERDKSFALELSWPDRRLSPNAREHWSVTSKLKRAYRTRCRVLGEKVGVQALAGSQKAVAVHLTFFPPDKRARDMDNMLASMKSGLDGLADAMGVDDSRWRISIEVCEPVKGGVVFVQINAKERA